MNVVLTGRCKRRRHLIFEVEEDQGEYTLVVERVAVGRERLTWSPGSRLLQRGRLQRYGCACGRTILASDDDMLDDIRRGETEWVIEGTNISQRRSGMGEQASE